jgi:hypothetical protein
VIPYPPENSKNVGVDVNGEGVDGNCAPMSSPAPTSSADHGTAARYESGKCRCDECREALMEARRRQREKRRQRVATGDTAHVAHGTWAAYVTDGCRCDKCRALKSSYMKQYRSRRRSEVSAP